MSQKKLLSQALSLIKSQKLYRRWLGAVTGMAAAVVFITTYLLILPAITMEHSIFQATASWIEAELGETILTEVYAEAADGREETFFVIKADGDNAGLDESQLYFDDDTACILDEDGREIELHREYQKSGAVYYWFVLEEGEASRFWIPWVNGTDRWRPGTGAADKKPSGDRPDLSPSGDSDAGKPELPATGSNAYDARRSGQMVSVSRHELPVVMAAAAKATDSNGTEMSDELILIEEGNPEAEGALSLRFGSGASLAKAKKRTDGRLQLSWLFEVSGRPVFQIPENAASWAAVEKAGFFATASNAVRRTSAFMAAVSSGENYDFSDNITSVTVSRLENGQWIPGDEFTDGDSVRMEIHYTIPTGVVGADNQSISYQLPDGIRLSREESGIVYDGQDPVGTYVIGTDGLISITFNDDFSDDKPFNGMVRFEGILDAGEDGEEKEIEFGGDGGTIIVKPAEKKTDIKAEKTGTYDREDGKLHYTITVSTENGTEGTVTIEDRFQAGNTGASYEKDSFQIMKVDEKGNKSEITGYAPVFSDANPPSFSLEGLPKLEAGETYIVTYTAVPEKSHGGSGAAQIVNIAEGTSGKDKNSSWNSVTISQEMIRKSGYYDSAAGKVKWTITLNADKQDISGYTLKDTMKIGEDEVSIPAGTVITMTGSDGKSQSISLPYTFPSGSSDTYTIQYETEAPESEPGESWSVINTAEIEKDGESYEGTGTVTGTAQNYNVQKSSEGLDSNTSADAVGTYKWVSRITVPKTEEVDLSKLTYTDTMTGASAGGNPVEGSHYITAELLDKLTAAVNGTALIRGTDYVICDAEGTDINDFADKTHLTGFQVKFLEAAADKINGQTVEIRYQTQVDYTMLEGDEIYTIANTGRIPDHESEADTTYEKPKKLEKQASITGESGTSYQDGELHVDYEESGGLLHYRLLIHTDENTNGDIILKDLLPRGAVLKKDSVKMRFYGNDWYEYDEINLTDGSIYTATEHIHTDIGNMNEDGTTPVTFTIDEGYNGDRTLHTLVIYYDVSIKEDSRWEEDLSLESLPYRNKVTWDSESSEMEITVEREVPDIEKTGEQLPQYNSEGEPVLDKDGNPVLSNIIRYYITVNAGGKDLVPDLEFITLWDKLDVGQAAGAEFLPGSVKLYRYDPRQENNCGQEIDSSLYAYIYDETQYVLTFSLPDETACVLVYEYEIDRGTADGTLSIKNEAHLTGGTSSGGGTEVKLEDTSSSAMATKRVLTVYKVDATNYGKLLPGAVFKLEEYKNGEWKTLLEDLTSDENGQFTLTRSLDEHFDNFNFEDNTLYKLTEIKPPPGYTAIDVDPYYFVWVKSGVTAEAVRQEMVSSGALGGVPSASVQFLTASGAAYIPNQPTELNVKKLWQDDSGEPAAAGAESVELTLYQQAVESNRKKVTVESTGHQSWSQTHTSIVNVAEDSGLTIQITGVYKDSLDIQVGEEEKVSVPTGSGQIWTYTIDCISGDTKIQISPTDQNEGNSFGNISFYDYLTPYYRPVGEATVYGTVTLNAGNGWSYTWSDLPKTNEDGKTIYYHVKEVTPVPGFEVIYSTNNSDGVQAGDLVVLNRACGYFLPETGGPGIYVFTAGGLVFAALSVLMYISLQKRRGELGEAGGNQ